MSEPSGDAPRKKRRLEAESIAPTDAEQTRHRRQAFLFSLDRSVTPPPRKFASPKNNPMSTADTEDGRVVRIGVHDTRKSERSPFQLTHIQDLPADYNADTVKLNDILGDPLIKECWQFNYLFDIDWLMTHFDSDVRDIVQVKIVHGSWKKEASNRIAIDDACQRRPNVKAITAYLPDPFGTHHSKMMILIRHDDFVQVVIHTSNMIPQDWTNMSQAVWRSPLLPLLRQFGGDSRDAPIGRGSRFKQDLLEYINSYRGRFGDSKLSSLTQQLKLYDFSSVKAALVASTPSRLHLGGTAPDEPLWGWPALRRALRQVPCQQVASATKRTARPHVVVQVSSIATLGKNDTYLKDTIFKALSTTAAVPAALSGAGTAQDAKFSIIFPDAETIRASLDGYTSGSSIHMKVQSWIHQQQLQYMRRHLCHWAPPRGNGYPPSTSAAQRSALRQRAAPHIKTYIRFTDSEKMDEIDWAMITSANLSTQAWGTAVTSNGEVRVQSYEIGVVVWPDLFQHEQDDTGPTSPAQVSQTGTKVKMIPTFGTDYPMQTNCDNEESIVGLRMPYDLPLVKYSPDDLPWCATMAHSETDWMGRVWGGYGE